MALSPLSWCVASLRALALPTAAAVTFAPRRTLFQAQPRPSLTASEAARLAAGRSRRDPLNNVRAGPRLSMLDHEMLARARRRGALELAPGCGQPLCNAYYRYCFAARRPYIALDRTGLGVTLDARCILGLGPASGRAAAAARAGLVAPAVGVAAAAAAEAAAVEAAEDPAGLVRAFLARADAAVAALPGATGTGTKSSLRLGVQVSSDAALRQQADRTLPGPGEGSNAARVALRSLSAAGAGASASAGGSSFIVLHVGGKGQAQRVADALFGAHAALFGLTSPADKAALALERRAERRLAERRVLLRQLRRLVADPDAVRGLRVRAGAVDGFVAAERAGAVLR